MEKHHEIHGFSTREAWTKWLLDYNFVLKTLSNHSYELIQSDLPDEEWIQQYKLNSNKVRAAYQQNEETLNWHIRWFTRTPERWSRSVADPLLTTLFRYVTRMQDLGTAYEIADSLLNFYQPLNDPTAMMKCYTIRAFAGGFFDIIHMSDQIHENFSRARSIYESQFSTLTPEERSMGLSIFDLEMERLFTQLKLGQDIPIHLAEMLDWYYAAVRCKSVVIEEDQNYEFNRVLPDFDYYMGMSALCITSDHCTPQQIDAICQASSLLYQTLSDSADADINYHLRTELVYHMACHLKGAYSEQQLAADLHTFMDQHALRLLTDTDGGLHAIEVVEVVQLIAENLIKNDPQEVEFYNVIQEFFIHFCATRPYSTYMDYISASYNYCYVLTVLPHIRGRQKLLSALLKLTVFRQVQTAMHSIMVGNLAMQILNSLIAYTPETLIGHFGTETAAQLCEKQNQFSQYIYCGSLLHDIGKLLCSSVVNAQSHRLTDFEFQILKFHPVSGAEMLQRIPELSEFTDLALGHHKSFDGVSGYPSDFDNTASSKKIFIDIISLCDSLDAATDHLGRNYTSEKCFERVLTELKTGKGTRYSDVLVDLILTDMELQENIRRLLEEGRRQVYCDVHRLILSEFSFVSCRIAQKSWPYNLV